MVNEKSTNAGSVTFALGAVISLKINQLLCSAQSQLAIPAMLLTI
jgi:hypothetical protein